MGSHGGRPVGSVLRAGAGVLGRPMGLTARTAAVDQMLSLGGRAAGTERQQASAFPREMGDGGNHGKLWQYAPLCPRDPHSDGRVRRGVHVMMQVYYTELSEGKKTIAPIRRMFTAF
jgi:hypothetical protein